jgi:hypothetical protein
MQFLTGKKCRMGHIARNRTIFLHTKNKLKSCLSNSLLIFHRSKATYICPLTFTNLKQLGDRSNQSDHLANYVRSEKWRRKILFRHESNYRLPTPSPYCGDIDTSFSIFDFLFIIFLFYFYLFIYFRNRVAVVYQWRNMSI